MRIGVDIEMNRGLLFESGFLEEYFDGSIPDEINFDELPDILRKHVENVLNYDPSCVDYSKMMDSAMYLQIDKLRDELLLLICINNIHFVMENFSEDIKNYMDEFIQEYNKVIMYCNNNGISDKNLLDINTYPNIMDNCLGDHVLINLQAVKIGSMNLILRFDSYKYYVQELFIFSCVLGKMEFVKFFGEKGANLADGIGIFSALNCKHFEIVKYLYQFVKNSVEILKGMAKAATYYGYYEIIEFLIPSKFNPEGDFLNELFIYAGMCGQLNIIKFFLKLGADINFNEHSVLTYNVEYQRTDVVNFLVDNGARITNYILEETAYCNADKILKIFLEKDLARVLNDGRVVQLAFRYGHLETIELLLEYGLNINIDPLFYEILNSNKTQTLKLLMKYNIPLNINHLLSESVKYKNEFFTKFLLENGADITYNNYIAFKHKNTPKHILTLLKKYKP